MLKKQCKDWESKYQTLNDELQTLKNKIPNQNTPEVTSHQAEFMESHLYMESKKNQTLQESLKSWIKGAKTKQFSKEFLDYS